MLGFNMFFAGFALFLGGVSYFVPFNRKALGLINFFAAGFMVINTSVGLLFANGEMGNYANAAAAFGFALNFLILGVHHFKELTDFRLFGWFSLLMSLTSIVFLVQAIVLGLPWLLIYLWAMWAVLWGQAFLASGLQIKSVDKASPYLVIGNSVLSLIAPALLLLLGVIVL